MENENKIPVRVRLYSHKSFRHYGGREIKTDEHKCSARLIKIQEGHQPFIVELLEPCAGYPEGHKIAVMAKDYQV